MDCYTVVTREEWFFFLLFSRHPGRTRPVDGEPDGRATPSCNIEIELLCPFTPCMRRRNAFGQQ